MASKKPPTIVIVDDEEIVLQSIGSFLELETDYEIKTFVSPKIAMDELIKQPIDLVISDFLMPEMNGLQFLKKVKELYPEIPLVLLTGYADKENAIKSINEIGLFQYLEKPWDNEQIKMIIRNGLKSKELNELLKEKLKELDQTLLHRDQLAQRDSIIKKELALAQKLQNNILPKNPFISDGIKIYAKYKPALEIGGDFYDVIRLGKNRIAILIADVTGHGIQAALSCTLLKFAFSHYTDTDAGLPEIIKGMNKILHQILPSDIFVAAMVVAIDNTNGNSILINAGNPHPFLLKKEDGSLEKIAVNGLILGVADDSVYQPGNEFEFQFTGDEKLVLHTDGLSEAEGKDGVLFEEGYLADFLKKNITQPLEKVLDGLLKEVEKFIAQRKSEESQDDITIIGIEINSK
jgi:serine phosphatase RsbU (regulator of sigma subunit)